MNDCKLSCQFFFEWIGDSVESFRGVFATRLEIDKYCNEEGAMQACPVVASLARHLHKSNCPSIAPSIV
jgi:hypothetical protein